MIAVIASLLTLVSDALQGRKSDEDVARGLIDAAFESGVAPALLLAHLTQKGRKNAELAADIAQFIKLQARGENPG
jgi:hypothetical protein